MNGSEDDEDRRSDTVRPSRHDTEGFLLNDDALEKIRRGLAEVSAGQTMSLEEARADFKVTFSARYKNSNR